MNHQLRVRLAFLAGMILMFFALSVVRLVGLSLSSAEELRQSEKTCLLISYHPERGNNIEQLIDIWGPVDYAEGTWASLNTGTIIGYSSEEDSEIWNLPGCD